jgi:hypothetical protein
MARTRSEPWKSFADWLTAQRGLNPASVSTYLTQVRRMLAEVTPLTSEGLVAWVDTLPAHHRSPHRTAWRCYVGWRASLEEAVPDLVAADPTPDVPPEVVDAIAEVVSGSRLKPRDLAGMTWSMRSMNESRDRAFPDKVFFKAPVTVDADLVLVPREALQVIGEWVGLIDAAPEAPVVPRSPSDPLQPMPATTMARLIRERRRALSA